jgi:hypothetical protein
VTRKVFLGDGHHSNWTIQNQQFSTYTSITDLLHALSYVYTAAVESSRDMDAAWCRYSAWARATWQGRIHDWLGELEASVAAASKEATTEKRNSCLTYLRNSADRMDYARYRQEGLPITTTQIESTIKQINRRMKGTEKFWDQGAEAQLQLCADRLSETDPLADYWKHHASNQNGFCNRCANT